MTMALFPIISTTITKCIALLINWLLCKLRFYREICLEINRLRSIIMYRRQSFKGNLSVAHLHLLSKLVSIEFSKFNCFAWFFARVVFEHFDKSFALLRQKLQFKLSQNCDLWASLITFLGKSIINRDDQEFPEESYAKQNLLSAGFPKTGSERDVTNHKSGVKNYQHLFRFPAAGEMLSER